MSSDSEMKKETETSSGCTPLSFFNRSPRLMQGLSWIGGLGVLSSGLVVAQTESSSDPVVVPITPAAPAASKPAPAPAIAPKPAPPPVAVPVAPAPKKPAPAASAPAPAPAPPRAAKPAAPAPAPAPTRVAKPAAPAPAPAPTRVAKPATPAPAPAASNPAPATPELKKPQLAAPILSSPTPSTVAKPPNVILSPNQNQETANTPVAPSNSYIDRTNYNIGATRRYEGPAAVVLSERSSGCQTVSQNGQLSSGVCGGGVAAPRQAPRQQTATAFSHAPASHQSGVTRLTKPSVSRVQPVQVSPVSVAFNSVRTNQSKSSSVTHPSFLRKSRSFSTYSQKQMPTGLSYYNLSEQPVGRPSLGKDTFMFPLAIPSAITSLFGWRVHPISGDHRFHAGTDLGAPQGTPVLAAVSGEVATADFLGGYGLTVILRHEDGTQESRYAHLSEIFVQPGEWVEQGTVIGRVGSTGNSTGPHLHFEWRHLTSEGWVAVDAGAHLEYALAQFIEAIQVAQAPSPRGF